MTNEIKPIDLSDPSIAKVVEALKSGKKMEAIMIYRSTHNVSIKRIPKNSGGNRGKVGATKRNGYILKLHIPSRKSRRDV